MARFQTMIGLLLILTVCTLPGCGSNGPDNSVPKDQPQISISPAAINFGTVFITSSTDLLTTISNTGVADLNIGDIASVDTLTAPFSLTTDTCSNQTLIPSGSCTITVRYTPTQDVITDTDSFDIPSNDPTTPSATVNVSGIGSDTEVPNILISPASLDFGDILLGATQDNDVTINNNGTANLVIGSIASLVAPFELVAGLDNCSGQSLPPTSNCTVTIRYSPTLAGNHTDSFDVPSNDPDTPSITVDVSGRGVTEQNIVVSPTSLDFGSKIVQTSTNLLVTVTNDGDVDLLLGDIASADMLAVPFEKVASLDNCSNQTLASAANCTVTINYLPTTAGIFSDSFDIPSNDPDSPTVTINVTGTSSLPTATALTPGTTTISSNLIPAVDTIDYWSFAATAGEVYAIEIFGTRLDQENWHLGSNLPHVMLISATGPKLKEHHFNNTLVDSPWAWGAHDLDIPMFYADQTATHYIAVSKEWPSDAGGEYAIRLTNVTPTSLVAGIEPAGADVRDPALTQVILPDDTVHADFTYPEEDNYAFDIVAPAIACFEITANRNGMASGELDYFDPTLSLYDADGTTLLVDGQTDADVDDYIFSDPKICYRFDVNGRYYVTLEESTADGYLGSSDYFLNYTLVDSGFIAGVNTNIDSGTAQPVVDGDWVNGSINNTGTDWYSYTGHPGDMIRISYFDDTNSQTATGTITEVALRNPGTGNLIYAADDPTPPTSGPGAFTLRGIPNAGSLSSTTSTYFFTLSGPWLTAYSVKFEKFRAAQSIGPATSQNTLEIQDGLNGGMSPTASERLDSNEYGAGDMDGVADVDSFQFNAVAGEIITINVYADQPFNSNDQGDKAQDLSGHGSLFEPVLRVYESPDTTNAIAIARFDPSPSGVEFDIAAEGVADFLPTISLTFEAPTNNLYYLTLSAEAYFPGSTYFFEVVRH